jgi:type IV secretory pathway VirD2 relaxase
MRTRGAGALIPIEYQDVTSPVVRLQVIYRPNQHYHEFAAYVAYLSKHGKGEDGGPGEHFTRDGQEPDIPAFLKRLWKTPWCFKVIVSPTTETGTHLPLRDIAQSWMQQVEADLGVKLDWVAGAHYDTDQPHVQLLWSGRTLAGELVRIDREYIGHGLRARAAELIDLYQ